MSKRGKRSSEGRARQVARQRASKKPRTTPDEAAQSERRLMHLPILERAYAVLQSELNRYETDSLKKLSTAEVSELILPFWEPLTGDERTRLSEALRASGHDVGTTFDSFVKWSYLQVLARRANCERLEQPDQVEQVDDVRSVWHVSGGLPGLGKRH